MYFWYLVKSPRNAHFWQRHKSPKTCKNLNLINWRNAVISILSIKLIKFILSKLKRGYFASFCIILRGARAVLLTNKYRSLSNIKSPFKAWHTKSVPQVKDVNKRLLMNHMEKEEKNTVAIRDGIKLGQSRKMYII